MSGVGDVHAVELSSTCKGFAYAAPTAATCEEPAT
jgi:3-oxoacyl-[acyl-carrier-protein] synthase III